MSMKFLIVSDTHGRMYNLEEAMEQRNMWNRRMGEERR